MYRIFTVNPGSTSTKIALFEDDRCVFSRNILHKSSELSEFSHVSEQLPYRMKVINETIADAGISLENIDAFVGRGGGVYSMQGGTYTIDETLISDTIAMVAGIEHPANLGSLIAKELQNQYGGEAYIVNPPTVDEFQDLARVTGLKGIYRKSNLHALNLKETAIRHAESLGRDYEDCSFIVCHIGGGISVSAHKNGSMIDGNDIAGGDGPMTPTRCGTIAASDVIRLCFSGNYTEKELLNKTIKDGGYVDIFGTSDAKEVSDLALRGNPKAKLYWEGMLYQIQKYIGSMAAVLSGKVDGILLGGSMVRDKTLVESIENSCGFIAPVTAYPGEFEMEAMAAGAVRVLSGVETAKRYTGKPTWGGFIFQ